MHASQRGRQRFNLNESALHRISIAFGVGCSAMEPASLKLDTLILGVPLSSALLAHASGCWLHGQSLVNRFSPPPTDLTCDSIGWEVAEELPSDERRRIPTCCV